jgi:hypothetical protein
MCEVTMAVSSFRYHARRVALLACPFCREMFEQGEAKACPVCGMALAKFEDLPPSHDAMHDEAGVPLTPETQTLPWRYMGRGKGALLALAALGIAMFFLPWVRLTMPHIDTLTAFEMAHRIGWLWGAGIAWLVLVPTVMSRRTIVQLRGARVAAAFLSAVPIVSVGLLVAFPPHGVRGVPVRFTWEWPMWVTLGVALAAVAVSLRLGGRVDDISVSRGSSKGQAVH